ncbi:flagellar biosynthesis protein FlhF [Brevibacillus fluminis]|uniref:flagellar biosynthesis protein FlhF n=1 Tax=Brevibacillus fluminis TaxID=511487 RepID=UPI003F8C873B
MRVKRYLVDSMPDALEKIRIDLGKDAIILNTKPVKTGGFMGLFSKRQIEVIAAVDAKQANDRSEKGGPAQAAAPVNSYVAKQAYQRTVGSSSPETTETKRPQPVKAAASPAIAVAELAAPAEASLQQAAVQEKAEMDQTPRTASIPQAEAAIARVESPPQQVASMSAGAEGQKLKQAVAQPSGDLAQELRDMRHVFQKLLLKPDGTEVLPDALRKVRDRLMEQELLPELSMVVLQEMTKRLEKTESLADEEANQLAATVIQEQVAAAAPVSTHISRTTKVAFFFGPTGVGKTTTIAKLAADAMLKERRKVGFITTDTFRIGAVEQLKTYANILNVPLEVVFAAKDLPIAMDRLAHCDLIFVDTAGRNYRNNEYVKGIMDLLEKETDSENYLILSLTSRYSDMKPIVQNFQDVSIHKVIFTKADETMIFGSILNVTHEFGLKLSYITIGQNVPDDIVIATPEVVASLILGERAYA